MSHTSNNAVLSNPKENIFALYEDFEEAAIIVRLYNDGRRVEISAESCAAIKTAMYADEMVEDSEGYDDDPTAFIYYLNPNAYVNLLTPDERKAVSAELWDLRVQFYGSEEKALQGVVGGRIVNGRLGRRRTW